MSASINKELAKNVGCLILFIMSVCDELGIDTEATKMKVSLKGTSVERETTLAALCKLILDELNDDATASQSECPTPITDAAWEQIKGSAFWSNNPARLASEDLERTMTQLFDAYKQKVRGEVEMHRFDKGALALLAEIQRKYPTLAKRGGEA